MGVRNRRAAQLIHVLQSQVDERLQSLDTLFGWATDREPVNESFVNEREMCSFFLSVTCHVVLRLHALCDRTQFCWQVIDWRVF